MTQRIVEDEFARKLLISFIERQDVPFTVNVSAGGRRSIKQNRLIHLWMNEIHQQMEGSFESAEQVRGYCKLHHGVPILRAADDHFRERYDAEFKPLPYELKLKCMMVPIEMPVTSRMTVKQLTAYLDAVHQEFAAQGVELTIPEDKGLGWRPAPPVEAYEAVQ